VSRVCGAGSQQAPSPTSDARGHGTFLVDDGHLGATGAVGLPFQGPTGAPRRDNGRLGPFAAAQSGLPSIADTRADMPIAPGRAKLKVSGTPNRQTTQAAR